MDESLSGKKDVPACKTKRGKRTRWQCSTTEAFHPESSPITLFQCPSSDGGGNAGNCNARQSLAAAS